jgi:hypothetical protein
MNHVVLSPDRSKSRRRRGIPTSAAKTPREMSQGESSPPYDPSQPATASQCTPNAQRIWGMKLLSWLWMLPRRETA